MDIDCREVEIGCLYAYVIGIILIAIVLLEELLFG